MDKKKMVWLKPMVFLVGLALLFVLTQPLFTVSDRRIYQTVKGFYKEQPESLDAIYIGASNVYASWQGPVAWEKFGIACYGFSIPGMPVCATVPLIEECRKTQPDALYIVNLNNFKQDGMEVAVDDVHNITNFLPMSNTKIKLINALSEEAGVTGLDKAEFFFPFIRFHSTWKASLTAMLDTKVDNLKGASNYSTFLKNAVDIEQEFCYTNEREPITEKQEEKLAELIQYSQNKNVKLLFVFSPQGIGDYKTVRQINAMKDYVAQKGFPVLDLMENFDGLELDLASDFYNAPHLNIHGSLKFTYRLGSYLMENYAFRDKRGEEAYASWDAAAEEYTKLIERYTLDFERENALRSNDLPAPVLASCEAYGDSIRISWKPTAGASGYALYRQRKNAATKNASPWQLVTKVDANTLDYTDKQLERNVTYYYTVAPFRTDGEKMVYGNFDIVGISARTVMPAPKLLGGNESAAGVTISWEAMPDADGYGVFRALGDQPAVELEQLTADVTTFTDSNYQPGLPYVYTVKAFEMVKDERQYGDWDRDGYLHYAPLQKPIPALRQVDDGLEISWAASKGASCYSVYVQDAEQQWQVVASHITDTFCVDRGILADTYMVVAELKCGSEYYEFPSDPVTVEKGDN